MRIPNLALFSAYSFIGTVSLMPLLVLPAMVGVLVDHAQLSESMAGWAAAASALGGALVAMALAFRMHRLDLRKTATLALGLAVLADTVSAYAAAPTLIFIAIRFATGVAIGAANVAAISAFPRLPDFERGYGLFVTLQFIVSGLGLYLLPVYSAELGAKGMYLCFAALDLCALILARRLPGAATIGAAVPKRGSELAVLMSLATLLAIGAFGLFEAANNAQFTYIERLGVANGYTDLQIGTALLIASLIGIPGAFSIVIAGSRFSVTGALTFGIAIAVAGLVALLSTSAFAGYLAAACCLGFSWAFCLPYIQTLLARYDRHGSAVAAGNSIATVGGAAGPGIAAMVVAGGNYAGVLLLSLALFMVCITCFLASARFTIAKPMEATG